jgi:hypothetical protein
LKGGKRPLKNFVTIVFLFYLDFAFSTITDPKKKEHFIGDGGHQSCGVDTAKMNGSLVGQRNKVFLLLLLMLQKSKENNHPICLCCCLACSFHQRKNKSQSSSSFCAISNFKLQVFVQCQASSFCTIPKFKLLYNLKIQASSPED